MRAERQRSGEVLGTYREAFRVYGRHPVALLGPGLVLFAVFGVPAAFVEVEFEELEGVAVAEVVGLVLLALTAFLASYLYYGYCEEIFEQARHGPVSTRRALTATIPVVPALAAASLLVGLGVVVGLVLAILPGLWLFTRWAVAAPVVSYERAGPLRALGRSHALARGRVRFVLLTAVAAVVAEVLLSSAADLLGEELSTNPVVQELVVELVVDVLLSPLAGLVVAAAYFRLRDRGDLREGGRSPEPAAEEGSG